jgi:post-segregation antitoxin (ccd killing protein)
MRTEVYSWRISEELKSDLEREARLRKVPVSAVLETAVRNLLKNNDGDASEEETQRKLHAAVSSCFGILNSGTARRAEMARNLVRIRLNRRNGR